MCKFTYNSITNCLMLKDNQGNLKDHIFYNNYSIENMSINDWLKMIIEDIKILASKNNIENYIFNLLED